ncbi:MAG TPA: hypothetical protein VGR73_23305 [Bryobacteraceae bacterium]|nr:hypothetical protein [Bryobacteraceae bacterium]
MSLSPADTPQRPPEEGTSPASPDLPPAFGGHLHSRLWAVCFAILAFEIGGFLVVFPWMEAWRLNHFPAFYPPLFGIWDDPYFRGAISGLGVVNILIAVWQTFFLLRRSKTT